MRFRKSIKITKGVRINFSKSGASLSLGGRGHSVNIGKRGVRSTIGIPGTGISYTTSTKSKRTGSSKRVTQKSTSQGKSSQFLVHLDMAGKVSILDPSTERPITDEATLRRIRSSQSFKDIKAELENDRQRKLTQIYNSSHEENKKFISIHRLAAPVDRMADYIRQRENIQLHKYQRDEFSKQKPSEEEIRSRLEMEALTAVSTKAFWKASSLRKQYVNDRLSVQYQEAVETWEAEKAAFESGQDAIEQKRNAEFAEEYNENVDYMNRIIEGDYETVCDAIDAWLEDLSLPVEIDVKLNVEGGEELYDEWQRRYNDYRKLCIEHGFWNYVIDDRNTFIPTTSQIAKEEEKKKEILDLLEAWKTRMSENQIIVEYLKKSPRKHALKKVMIKDISNGDSEKRKTINAIYRRLIRAKVIAEKENHDGEIETRIVIHRKKKEISKKPMPASVYHSDLYSNIRKKDIYKVDYTVSEPQDLDRQNNTCYFVSKSSGEIYSTSLEKCSCPVYQKGCACKHMLALAMRLGYYQRWNAQ